MPTRRSDAELTELFTEQLGYLQLSSTAYDDGRLAEAKRLAVTLRVVFHQTNASHSLRKQLRAVDRLKWLDSAGAVNPANLLATSNLTVTEFTSGGPNGRSEAVYKPNHILPLRPAMPGETKGQQLAFGYWWEMAVVKDTQGNVFSRKQLILALANKEGGAHVDPSITASYEALAKSNSLGWVVADAHGERPVTSNPVYPSVRQIAWETLASVESQRPDLMPPTSP